MADEIEIVAPSGSKAAEEKIEIIAPGQESQTFKQLKGPAKQVARGAMEAVPFYGEKIAERADLPMPSTFSERLTRRAARNAPYALAAAPFTGGVPAALGFGGSVLGGTIAEEIGLPESYQTVAEMAGPAGITGATKIAGKTLGYIEPQLVDLAKKASTYFEIGPGARTSKGMKYGAGDTETAAVRNLNSFTEEASKRAGYATNKVDSKWIEKTSKDLGKEANTIFKGKTFSASADPEFTGNIARLVNKAEGAFGEQGNVLKNVLDKNIRGDRPQGSLISEQFSADDLRAAIVDVNGRLDGASGNQAYLLHELKDSLERLADKNLRKIDNNLANQYIDWKSKYSAFATIRDLMKREGSTGVTSAGQINPKTLKDVIDSRTGGNATRSVLFNNLAEFGDILKAKPQVEKGAVKAAGEVLTESPLAKALGAALQPRVMSLAGERARLAQTLAPGQRFTQQKPDEVEILGKRLKNQ
jgi:hypothetical protein